MGRRPKERCSMDVGNIMSKDVQTIEMNESVVSASRRMKEANVGCLVVTDAGALWGIITDRDLAIACLGGGDNPRTCHVALHTTRPPIFVDRARDVIDAAQLMTKHRIRRLPVMDGDELVGLVSLADIALAIDLGVQNFAAALHDMFVGMGAARAS